MIFYNIGSIIKIIIGFLILILLYSYVNIYKDPGFALTFGFIGIFLFIRGISFYLFFVLQKLFIEKDNIEIASKSYKLSLLLGLYILSNLGLVIIDMWNNIIGIGLLVLFIVLQILTYKENE